MAQELIWLTLLALAVVVILTGWMKYLRKPAWSGRAFAVLVLTNLPTLGLLDAARARDIGRVSVSSNDAGAPVYRRAGFKEAPLLLEWRADPPGH